MVWRFALICPLAVGMRHIASARRSCPRAEVLRMEPPDIDNLTIDMQELAETEMGGFAPLLTPLIDDYEDWIAEKSAYFAAEPEELQDYRNETAVVEAEWVERAGTHQSRNRAARCRYRCGARFQIRQSRHVAAAYPHPSSAARLGKVTSRI